MPLSQTELTTLKQAVQAVADEVDALVVDPETNPLQVQLDEANATIASLQAKIDAAKQRLADAATADAAEDAAREAALAELG